LIVVLNVQESDSTMECFFGQISQHMTIMGYPEVPLGITGIYCREEADRMPCNFHGMLVAENMDGLKSCGLNGVDEMVATTSISMGCH
jgi:hypothetical protein